jgi:indoleamine 2,3-dioxygenase
MLAPIPRLEEYGLSPKTGFLPSELPLQRLPHPAYDKWERIINNFQSLLLSKRLRIIIDRLPVLPTSHLETEPEWRRAYSMLAFMAHGYIWGGEKPAEILPPPITYPLLQVSTHLGLPPVATYSGLCLWNYKPIFLSDNLTLDNLSTLTTFTGSTDEQWFYLVSVAIEARGGPSIPLMLDAIDAARCDEAEVVTACLRSFAEILDELGGLLVRMYENCDPHVFYHRIRPYLAGSKNMRDAGLPRGVKYDDGTKNATWRQYGGGSNAQSSLIQFFDIVLGIEHRPTGEKRNESSESEAEPGMAPQARHNFIHEMRQYMPGAHRKFLQAVESVANIREYVESHQTNTQLCIAYDACLAMLRALRDKHIQMVSRYIIIKSRESRSMSGSRHRSPNPAPASGTGIASLKYEASREDGRPATAVAEQARGGGGRGRGGGGGGAVTAKRLRGTGGTALIPFLRQARDETGEPAIDAWARKLMSGARRTQADAEMEAESRAYAGQLGMLGYEAEDDGPMVVGLAGSWNMEDNGGGLCQY